MRIKKVARYLIFMFVALGSSLMVPQTSVVAQSIPTTAIGGAVVGSPVPDLPMKISRLRFAGEMEQLRILGFSNLREYLQALRGALLDLNNDTYLRMQQAFVGLPADYRQMFHLTMKKMADAKKVQDLFLVHTAEEKALQEKIAAAARQAAEAKAQALAKAQAEAEAQAKAAADAQAQQQAQADAQAAAAQPAAEAPAPQQESQPQQAASQQVTIPNVETPVDQSTPPARARSAEIPNTITLLGQVIGIEDSQGSAAAPYDGNAGYWQGNGSTTDGMTTHIIGHNPGIFNGVLSLGVGSQVKVTDRNGQSRTYTVYALMDVNDYGYDSSGRYVWNTILGQGGESISLQTCINDDWNRMVLAR